MTDAELDQVSARGVGDAEEGPVLDLGGILASAAPDGTGALFSFDLGSVFGNGSIDLNGLAPSALTLNGSLSPAVLQVENLILNINICAGCRADVIHQIGLGVPIKITSPPTQ